MSQYQTLIDEFAEIEAKLSAGPSPDQLKTLSQRHAELTPVMALVKEHATFLSHLDQAEQVLAGSDAEMKELAVLEKNEMREKIAALEADVGVLTSLERG